MINILIHQLFSANHKSADFKKFTESFNSRDITSLYIASSLEIGRESKLKMGFLKQYQKSYNSITKLVREIAKQRDTRVHFVSEDLVRERHTPVS